MSNAPPRRATPVSDRGVARGRPQRAGPPVPTALSELLGQLEATSVGAELQAVDARDVERDTLALLGQTARALHALTGALRDDQRAAGRRPNDTAEFEVEFGAELGAERT